MANTCKRYRGCRHPHVPFVKPTFNKYITGLAEWAKGCSTLCKKCGKEITNPTTEVHGNSVTASYVCKCGHTTCRIATESEIRRKYSEV